MTLIDLVAAAQEVTDDDREVVRIVRRLLENGAVMRPQRRSASQEIN